MKTIKIFLYVLAAIPISLIILYLGYAAYVCIVYPPHNCENNNPIFENYAYDSKEYKSELIRLLKDSEGEKTKFWFGKYLDSTHILVDVQNEKICAKGHLTVEKWEGFMKNLKRVKGVSYNGPLIGLQYKLVDDPNNPEIIFIRADKIID